MEGEGAGDRDVGHAARAGERLAGEELARGAHAHARRTLGLLKQWLSTEALLDSKLVLLTDNALCVHEQEAPNLFQAVLVGMMRSAHSEHPGRFALIDLDGTTASQQVLHHALASAEPEIALRNGTLHVPRLARLSSGGSLIPPAGERAWHLAAHARGTLEGLTLSPNAAATAALSPGQVRVAMHAAGLNFRDVLIALGVYPGEARIGGEGAGIVIEVAPDVSGLAVGDRVMGIIPDAFGPVAISDRRLLVKVPADWSFVEAASVPIVFLTAYYALVDLAGVTEGESLLLHSAAGGVGMAALQLARHLGAEVFATAHPDKWTVLRELGVDRERIASSRSTEFKERLLAATDGRGVDVVLSSLAGELVDASLELMPRGGRFIEMGKTDVRDADAVAERHANVSYRAFDLIEAGPERIQEMLKDLVSLFERGVLRLLPLATWDVRRGVEAFRFLRESRHTGKLVLTIPQAPGPGGTVLITGGTGGLGALLAAHLAREHGVRQLLLLSRRGEGAPGAEELKASLQELGCQTRILACDVADEGQLRAAIAGIPQEHPLTAVVHSAGVLDDGVIESLDDQRLASVLTPKIDAAIHLHELTKEHKLTQFILLSSAVGTLGGPGQGNYAAANVFLDALSQYRHSLGLPAISLALGAWAATTGMTAGLGEPEHGRFARAGIGLLSDSQGLQLVDLARGTDRALLLPARLDRATLRAQARTGTLPAILRGLFRTPARRATDAGDTLSRQLAVAPASEHGTIVLDLVLGHAAAVLGHAAPGDVERDRAFKELGFDSLGAVELRNRLSRATGLRLPATLIFDHPSPTAVAAYVLSRIAPEGPDRPAIDEQIGKLEEALAAMATDGEELTRVGPRLHGLIRRLQMFLEGDDAYATTTDGADPADAFDSATEAEILAFLDKRRADRDQLTTGPSQ